MPVSTWFHELSVLAAVEIVAGMLRALLLTRVGPVAVAFWCLAAAAQSNTECPSGQSVSSDTQGHCCWPNQLWSPAQQLCRGVPSCPSGFAAAGEACVASCPVGQAVGPDTQGQCCWPGQVWSGSHNRCRGLPSCPPGTNSGPGPEDCSAAAPRTPPRPPPEPPRVPLRGSTADCEPGARWDDAEQRCVATFSPRIERVPESAGEDANADPYLKRGFFDFEVSTAYDFVALMEGMELVPHLTFARGTKGRWGMYVGAAAMSTLFGAPRTQTVVFAPVGLFFAFRLGLGSELRLKGGTLLGQMWVEGTTVAIAKLSVALDFLVTGNDRGSGFCGGVEVADRKSVV